MFVQVPCWFKMHVTEIYDTPRATLTIHQYPRSEFLQYSDAFRTSVKLKPL